MSKPLLPFDPWVQGTDPEVPWNDNALRSAILGGVNIDNATTAQPALTSPADDYSAYIIQSTHTGAQWTAFTPDSIAIFVGGGWYEFTPTDGARVSVSGTSYVFDGSDWTPAGGTVSSVVAGSGITVDNTDPSNPVVAVSSGGIIPVNPDTYPSSPANPDDEFDTGTSIDTAGTRRVSAVAWSLLNSGGSFANSVNKGHLAISDTLAVVDNVRGVVQAVTGTWRYRAKLSGIVHPNSNYWNIGMIVRNTANSRFMTLAKTWDTSWRLSVVQWSAFATANSTLVITDIFTSAGRSFHLAMYLEIENNGTSLIFRYSDTGVDGTFITFHTATIATYIAAVDQIGLHLSANGGACVGAFDWFRKMA